MRLDVGGGDGGGDGRTLNPGHPSAKSTTASKEWEKDFERVTMTRSSASVSKELRKMRAWRLRQHAVTLPIRVLAGIIQWNIRGIRSYTEELQLLCKQYKPQVVAVQECQLRENKVINLNGSVAMTKSSPYDNSTGVSIYIKKKSYLFSEIKLDTDLQAVPVRVTVKKPLTVCNVYLLYSKM